MKILPLEVVSLIQQRLDDYKNHYVSLGGLRKTECPTIAALIVEAAQELNNVTIHE